MSKNKEVNKTKSKNVTSIAIKLNSNTVRDLFSKLLVLDICLIFVIIVLWCIDAEKSFFGELALKAQRSFHPYPIQESVYKVVLDNGRTLIKQADTLLYGLKYILIALGIVEGIFILERIIFGTAQIRKTLRPLNEIAEAAERLSSMSFDEEKFHNLEEAISKISPVASEERIYIDDRELKGLEDAINKLLDRMRDTYRQQARFVSDASHELRTPISVIQGYANMLDRWGKNDESVLEESIKAIKSEAEAMKNLVEQLLFLARGVNGKTKLNLEEVSLNHMLQELLEESSMIDGDHVYTLMPSEDINIYGDFGLLKQTGRILIENAAKYTEKGEEIILRSGISSQGQPYFSVQDNGIGMDEGDVVHIFDRFFRADTARARKTGGTGLGLSIAKWIVDSHKGYFSVLSRKGIGTRITVFLPATKGL